MQARRQVSTYAGRQTGRTEARKEGRKDGRTEGRKKEGRKGKGGGQEGGAEARKEGKKEGGPGGRGAGNLAWAEPAPASQAARLGPARLVRAGCSGRPTRPISGGLTTYMFPP